jgi:hypothetical protein
MCQKTSSGRCQHMSNQDQDQILRSHNVANENNASLKLTPHVAVDKGIVGFSNENTTFQSRRPSKSSPEINQYFSSQKHFGNKH